MASLLSLRYRILLLSLILVLTLSVSFSSSSALPRRALNAQPTTLQKGFKVKLKHVDHVKNLTRFERLQRGVERGRSRLQRLNAASVLAATSSEQVKAPVVAGNGEFLMKLSIGTPAGSFSAIMDTGSDLIWTQCKPCRNCFDQSTPIFDPNESSTFSKIPCSSNLCEALPISECSDGCEYLYIYGDSSSTRGVLGSETFAFGDVDSESGQVSIPGIGFGCGDDNEGEGFSQGAGLVGLGRGPLSLVSQLNEQKFAYCLTAIDDTKSSALLMGSLANVKTNPEETKTTPLIKNPSQPSFYYLSLEGISVGDTRLPIPKSTFQLRDDGTGGLIIDSGTTITFLEETAFNLLKHEFISQTRLTVDNSGSTGLDLCFNLPSGSTNVEVPKLTFHFEGADLELPGENYMIADSSLGLICLAMGGSSGFSIYGNIQQQNFMVIHDLQREVLSFVHTQCDNI